MKKKYLLRMPEGLHEKISIYASTNEITKRETIVRALEEFFKTEKKEVKNG